jgi:putative membrane-bound dehydrogenase-like protein
MLLALVALAALLPPQSSPPLRVFLRGGPKTHGPNQHEHERFVAEWKPLLDSRGAKTDGATRFPTADELARTDVLVVFAAEGASIHGEERSLLDAFLARGGGLVVLHDGVCGDDPHWFKTVAGGAWEHGHAKWHEGLVDLYVVDKEHPITRGIANFRFQDEIYTDLHLDPAAHVLVRGFDSVFDASPQAWTFEKGAGRVFVSIQGHEWSSFSHPAWRALVLRGIAWAGGREADLLVAPEELAALAYPPGGPIAPERAKESLELHPDFDVSLVASEPLIANPISIEWDARGRMWVAETPGYPEKERFSGIPAHDRISILEDKDGDGRMDAKKVFADKLDLVTSLVLHRDGAIVTQAPDILFLRDTNGDDVADKRETLFTGFGIGDTHAVISNLRWGLDGWIYGTQGYSGNDSRHVTNAAGKDFGHIGNGIFRFLPDGSAIEVVSAYGSNTWGLDFSDENELFFTMANGAHLRHVVVPERVFAGGRTGKVESWADCPDHDRVAPVIVHDDAPYAQIDFVGGFTAASGCCLYTGGAWPAEWRNAHFTCEPTVHIVHHDRLEPDGVTFKATKARDAEFLAGKDLWFRPVHLRVGPDGALYVLDFYNQAVVHNDTRGPPHGPTNFALRPDRDHDHGRIWRVQHRQATRLAVPDLSRAGVESRVAALEHPNAWVRSTAQRLIVEQGLEDESILASALRSKLPAGRIIALWTLHRLDRRLEPEWEPALEDPDPAVRANAVRIALPLAGSGMLSLLEDRSPRVRLEALVALGDPPSTTDQRAIECLVRSWPSMTDPWMRNATLRYLGRRPVTLMLGVLALYPGVDGRELAEETLQRASRGKDVLETLWDCTILGLLTRGERVRTSFVAAMLDRIETPPPEPNAGWRSGAEQDLKVLLAQGDLDLAASALRLAQRWKMTDEMTAEIDALAGGLLASVENGDRGALTTLLALPEHRARAIEASRRLLGPSASLDDQLALVDVLAQTEDAAAARILCDAYPTLSTRAQDRIYEKLIARAAWTGLLLDEIGAKRVDARELGPQKLHRLRTHADAATAARARDILDAALPPSKGVAELVASLLPEVDGPGDAANGKSLFTQNCSPCHTVRGEGGHVGPDLTGMGVHGARQLLPVILDPSRAVEAAYSEWVVETNDGRLLGGVIAREGPDSVLLRWSGGEEELQRGDIASMRNTRLSPMPAGFESLGAAGLRDVIAFLAQGTEGFRTLDLEPLATSDSHVSLYDARRDPKPMKFARYGIVEVRGMPFEILDPARSSSGCNALVLKGGLGRDWESKIARPQRVEVPVGFVLAKVHVLGGIAAYGYPYVKEPIDALKWTWRYADGTSEEVVLKNGVEFADWIGRYDVPGSEGVDDLLAGDSWGQIRYHALAPSKAVPVESIVLESFDNALAPTILALTAELPGAKPRETKSAPPAPPEPLDVFLFGGGSSHDFERWFGQRDLATLAEAGIAKARFSTRVSELLPQLASTKVLVLSANQPLPGPELRRGIVEFVEKGGGLLVLHPAIWFNWSDWPEYNAGLVGGGSRSHEDYGEFEVRIEPPASPLTRGIDTPFRIQDELYRAELDPSAADHVLATGRSLKTGAEFPVAWSRARGRGHIVCITLGHDGGAHELASFRKLLANSVSWLLEMSRER